MNRPIAILFFSLVYCSAFTQDSTAAKNIQKINELRMRVERMEAATDPGAKECAVELGKLNRELKVKQDSLKLLLNKLMTFTDEKNKAEQLKLSMMARIQLGECNCSRLFYNPDQHTLDYVKFSELDSISRLAKSKSNYTIRLIGHADKTGTESRNITLSKQRVEGIKNYLVSVKGLKAQLIETEWHGSALPIKDTQDAAKQFLNRRVEIFLTYP